MGEGREGIEAYPLCWPAGWPRREAARREHARFFGVTESSSKRFDGSTVYYKRKRDKTVAEARDFLKSELARLGARDVVISTNMRTRQDGEISGSASAPADPGVAVYFRLKGNDRCFPCDRWSTVADNLWAIGKSIEAMRGLERWGAERMVDAAFTGFRALPETTGASRWREVLGLGAGVVSADDVRSSYRRLALERHPDKNGGDEGPFLELKAAFDQALQEIGAP